MTHYESLFESINISAPRLANQIRGFGFYSKRKIHSFCNKRTKKEAMREITLSSLAATKMMLHCYKYPHLRKSKNIHFLIPRPVLNLKKFTTFFGNFFKSATNKIIFPNFGSSILKFFRHLSMNF